MATKHPDPSRELGENPRGLTGTGSYDETSGARTPRPQDTAGRQTYGTSGSLSGTPTGQRDFYREALARSASRGETWRSDREELRPYDRREDYTSYAQPPARYGYGELPTSGYEGYQAPESYRTQETYRGEEWRERQGPRPSERQEGGWSAGRTAAVAAGLGAVGYGLLRRGRWSKEALTAGEIMSRGVKTVLPEHTLHEVARIMREENVGIVPVADARGRLLGVVTDRDIVVRSASEDRLPSQVRVADIMSSEDLEVATPDDTVNQVIDLMGRKQVRRIPVVERDNRLVGIISIGDIATRAEYDEELQAALERISSRRSFWLRLG